MSDNSKLLELYEKPLSGPMIEIYAKQREEMEVASRRAAMDFQKFLDKVASWKPHDGGLVVWRMRPDIVPLCADHALELVEGNFTKPGDLRPVWDDAKIVQVAALTGQLLDEVRDMHARFLNERCTLCGVQPSLNICTTCQKPLHLQWPSLYCSNKCAIEDI